MFVVTAVYAGLTLLIFFSNCRSNKLLAKQIEDSNKQHEENRHLEILPYLKVDSTTSQTSELPGIGINIAYFLEGIPSRNETCFKVTLENVGQGNAVNIQYLWALKNSKGEYLVKGTDMLLPNALTIGEKREVLYQVHHPPAKAMIEQNLHHLQLYAGFIYEDILSVTYRQDVMINIEIKENHSEWIIHSCHVEKQKKLETSQEQNT